MSFKHGLSLMRIKKLAPKTAPWLTAVSWRTIYGQQVKRTEIMALPETKGRAGSNLEERSAHVVIA
jgi:hypothetical protein